MTFIKRIGNSLTHVLALNSVALLGALMLTSSAGAQSSVFSGLIIEKTTRKAVSGAMVEVHSSKTIARADSNGAFRIRQLPAGRNTVVVRAIGYDAVTVVLNLAANDSVDLEFVMSPTANVLSTIRVDSSRERFGWRLREFEQRRVTGFGRFLDDTFFETNVGRYVPNLLSSRVPGLGFDKNGRLYTKRNGKGCSPQVVVNGIVRKDFDIEHLNASEIIGFEFHTVATTPLQYNATGESAEIAPCGTAIFWLK